MEAQYEQLRAKLARIADIRGAMGLLSWDQETYMPRGSTTARAHQLSTLAGMAHGFLVDEELGALLEDLNAQTAEMPYDAYERSIVRVMWREYQKQVRIPVELVVERAQLNATAKEAWREARANDDFATFQPYLEQQLDLALRYADALGYDENPYDALVDAFEPGLDYATIAAYFSEVKPVLASLIEGITANAGLVDDSVLKRHYPSDDQIAFTRLVSGAVGFDYQHGRLDLSTHPFTGGTSYMDVRLTTRVDEYYLPNCVMAGLHEAGHGIHAQRTGEDNYRLPFRYGLATAESQSRFYENHVGRSYEFWQHFFPILQDHFPHLNDVDLDTFYFAINQSEPSLIRVEADEVTYGMHIMLRFELENELINGTLTVADLPEAWNARMATYLGVTPPGDAQGVLQDIHWSQGYIGYFPDYLLGSMLSAQLWQQMESEYPAVRDEIAAGEFAGMTNWLAENVQQYGGQFTFLELAERAGGGEFSAGPYLAYLTDKFSAIYDL